jgi:hypothetical protein
VKHFEFDESHQLQHLVPVLDNPIQIPRYHFTRLSRMPCTTHHRNLTCLDLMQHLTRFPTPPAHIPSRITAHDEFAIRAYAHIDSMSCIIVAAEPLLSVLTEAFRGRVDNDLVVAALEGDEFFGRMVGRAS